MPFAELATRDRYHRSVATYDPSTALLVVDVQNDFADPSGSLSVAGGGRCRSAS